MKVYATKYKIFKEPSCECEFEVLNELENLSSRKDSNCKNHTRFLFELDELPLFEQYANLYKVSKYCHRITFSGKKSLHHIMEFDPKYEDQCKILYKEIWTVLNETLFAGNADSACSNPARLTRRPGAYRQDNGVLQKLICSNGTFLDGNFAKMVLRRAKSLYIAKTMKSMSTPNVKSMKIRNGLCANYDVVTRYLKTLFPNVRGNGVSSKWLYGAIACCLKYNDMETLERVRSKALSEHWTMKELERINSSINNKDTTNMEIKYAN